MEKKNSPKKNSKLLWTLLFIVIAAGTVWAVISQGKTFTLAEFFDYIGDASLPYLLTAALCTAGFIIFEGEAVRAAVRALGYNTSHRRGLVYSAADIYFSAITPSATGGQPVCGYFMVRDGIPTAVTTIALLLNLMMYTASILVIAFVNAVLHADMFLAFDGISEALIIIGYVIQALLGVVLLLLLFREALLHRLCSAALRFLARIRIIRNVEEKQEKLGSYFMEYEELAAAMAGKKSAMLRIFLLNLAQRISLLSVSSFVYLASGGSAGRVSDIWAIQCYSVVGSNTIPIPGAMGVADYIMLDGFAKLLPEEDVVSFELLSRGISFYACVLVCGLIALVGYIIQNKREKRL